MFHPGKIKTYKPIVSDVSDDELLETVKELEKSRNVPRHSTFSKQTGGGDRVPLGNL